MKQVSFGMKIKRVFLLINWGIWDCDALRDLVPVVQFKKREKHPWRSINLPATLLKVTLLHGCFSRFLNCTNGTKSRNAAHINVYLRCPLYSNLISLLFHFIMSLDVSVKLNKVSFFWLVSNSFTPHVTVPNWKGRIIADISDWFSISW